jgi:hypothetical protein
MAVEITPITAKPTQEELQSRIEAVRSLMAQLARQSGGFDLALGQADQ